MCVAIIASLLAKPAPYLTLGPGQTLQLVPTGRSVVDTSIGGSGRGEFRMTTVSTVQLSYWQALVARMSGREIARIDNHPAVQPNSDGAQQMIDAEATALAVAAERSGMDPEAWLNGWWIQQVAAGSPAAQAGVTVGDVLLEVDSTPIRSFATIGEILATGGAHELLLERNGEAVAVAVTPQGGKIGVIVTPRTQLDVSLDVGAISGPSGGLMLTLAFLDAFTEGDLTAGLHIAGTGTIDEGGNVGEISGVEEKLKGARKANADVFFVPRANAPALKDAPTDGPRVVVVDTVADALRWLCRHDGASGWCRTQYAQIF